MAEKDQQTEIAEALTPMPLGVITFPIMYIVIPVVLLIVWTPLDTYLRATLMIPLIIPYFGLLGGLIESLQGIFLHNKGWKPSYSIWHGFSGLVGAVYGFVSYLFLRGILKTPFDPQEPFFYALAAFALGYAQHNFHVFMGKIFSVIFQPHTDSPTVKPTDKIIPDIKI